MKSLVLIFSIFSLYASAQMNAYYQQHVSYTMQIDMDVKNHQYTGKQTVEYTNNSPETLHKVYFHLYWNAFKPNSMMDQRIQYMGQEADGRMVNVVNEKKVSRIKDLPAKNQGYQQVTKLTQNGKNVNYRVEGTVLVVELAQPIAAQGGKTTFNMEWHAQVPEQIRRSGRKNSEGIEFSMTQWYPKMAEYDYEGWHAFEYIQREFQGVFGDFDVTLNLPKNYIVAAGGELQNPNQVKGYSNQKIKGKGNTAWHFKAHNIHDFAWSADPDYTVETQQVPNGPKLYFVYQKNEKTAHWTEAQQKAVQFFTQMNTNFGAYTYPTYTFAQGGDGGMEYGMITLIMGNKRATRNEQENLEGLCGLMFHEAAHSWFQHIIATNESMRAWMDEGFTSYAEEYCMSKIFPESMKGKTHFNQNSTLGLAGFQKAGREELMCKFADNFETSSGYSVAAYVKGSVLVSTLGYIVGEEVVKDIMKEYFNTWKHKHPTERDFMHIAQKVSGMDLKWFFNQFIYTTDMIDYSIEKVSASNNKTQVELKNNSTFPMPIDLLVTLKDGTQTTYNIPLQQMRANKTKDIHTVKTLPDWQWTSTTYTAELPVDKSNIKSIQIDGTNRLPNTSEKQVFED